MQKLYLALKADEQVWGTTQLFALPVIRPNGDHSINASGDFSTNSINVKRGLFDFADRAGTKGDDVLAAALSHELSHIFYRHSTRSGAGLNGLFDELRGVTDLDRVQEQEADILGIRVACQAGFDPDGMLILVREIAAIDGTASSFMRNHPSGIERLNYLRGEAAKCQALQSQLRQRPIDRDSGSQRLWTLVQNPKNHWKFSGNGEILFGEEMRPEEQRSLSDYNTVDVKKTGNKYVGTQTVRATFRVKDTSPIGFHFKACKWEFGVELTSVRADRIEGRWEGYGNSNVDPLTCTWSGERIWEGATWTRE
jgi:hypothetical protein